MNNTMQKADNEYNDLTQKRSIFTPKNNVKGIDPYVTQGAFPTNDNTSGTRDPTYMRGTQGETFGINSETNPTLGNTTGVHFHPHTFNQMN